MKYTKSICQFLSGAFFVTAGASWYFASLNMAVPFSYFGYSEMMPEFLWYRGFLHFGLFLLTFYVGFIRK